MSMPPSNPRGPDPHDRLPDDPQDPERESRFERERRCKNCGRNTPWAREYCRECRYLGHGDLPEGPADPY